METVFYPRQCLIDQGQLLYNYLLASIFLNFFAARISALPSWIRCRPSLAWLIKATSADSSVSQTQAVDCAPQPSHLRNPAEYQTSLLGPVFVED